MSALYTDEELAEYERQFHEQGFVVLKGVLSPEDVATCRAGLHAQLLACGVDADNLDDASKTALKRIQSHTSGGLPFYYSAWRIRHCALNARVYQATRHLWSRTYAPGHHPDYECPWAPFPTHSAFAFVDSINFRLPSADNSLSGQKPLRAHIDVNPFDLYGGRKGRTRWRPFQGFISLTDNSGGFQCVQDGFHREFDRYFSQFSAEKQKGGLIQLWRLKEHADLVARIKPVQYEAGDAVLWDWRVPHRVAEEHPGDSPREVVYTSFLPCLQQQNVAYARKQGAALRNCVDPPDFQRGKQAKQTLQVDRSQFLEFLGSLSDEEQRMLGLK